MRALLRLADYRTSGNGPPLTAVLLAALALAACDNPAPGEGVDHEPMADTQPAALPAASAVKRADVPKSDPGAMDQAEIDKVLPAGPRCGFAYTAESPPVLAAAIDQGEAAGVFKIHGRLARLAAAEITDFSVLMEGGRFTADGVRLIVTPIAGEVWDEIDKGQHQRPAHLRFELDQGLRRDYRGWYRCNREDNSRLD